MCENLIIMRDTLEGHFFKGFALRVGQSTGEAFGFRSFLVR